MPAEDRCTTCRRPIESPDRGCDKCGRTAIDDEILTKATALVGEFGHRHARDPWLRSAALLSYSLRSRRRGFLDDPARPFTRDALRLLWSLASYEAPGGLSPLVDTALNRGLAAEHPILYRALNQLVDLHRDALQKPGESFDQWIGAL